MDGEVAARLLDIVVVLLAARGTAELGERLRVPGVVAEILAGFLVGPAVLGLVEGGPVLDLLAELGVILLLFEVGLHTSLAELRGVGGAALGVAAVGVLVPLAGGLALTSVLGLGGAAAWFVGAALTATSVGISARVFGDLRALGSFEARTVLAAAVADDVLGLILLTIVSGLATAGGVSVPTIAGALVGAVAFLLGAGWVGSRLGSTLMGRVHAHARVGGTTWVVALAITLSLALAAHSLGLAAVVGAFLAGLLIASSPAAEEVRRGLGPVAQMLVPIFFLRIGLDVNPGSFLSPHVLGLAGALGVVAVAGKAISGAVLRRAPGDRLLVGLGMIPRGEVGLIFAGVGLASGVLDADLYAALVLVVLATTLLTPPLLRWRLQRLRSNRHPPQPDPMPVGGWLTVRDGMVELAAQPPPGALLLVALQAAQKVVAYRPGPRLVAWCSEPDGRPAWDTMSVAAFFTLLGRGGPRAWRFLDVTGILQRSLPELSAELQRRHTDPHDLDPWGALHWSLLERTRRRLETDSAGPLPHPEWVLLAALLIESLPPGEHPVAVARRVVRRLDLGAEAEETVALLVGEQALLVAAAARPGGLGEEPVLQIAAHLVTPPRARSLYLLSLAAADLEPWEEARLSQLHSLIQAALSHPELVGLEASNLIRRRRLEAGRLMGNDQAGRDRIEAAPHNYILTTDPADMARHAALLEPPPRGRQVRVGTDQLADGSWRVEVATRDRHGLLARVTGVLAEAGMNVTDASATTWGDGVVLESFRGTLPSPLDEERLSDALRASLDSRVGSAAIGGVRLSYDDHASPWYTLVEAHSPDRPGLLHALVTAMAAAGIEIHSARVSTIEGEAIDRFEVTDVTGRKLGVREKEAAERFLETGVRLRRRTRRNATASKHSLDRVETSLS